MNMREKPDTQHWGAPPGASATSSVPSLKFRGSSSMIKRVLIFLDGENLVCRYQDMIEEGKIPNLQVVHEKDCFVWSPEITRWSFLNVIRVTYYASVVGDDKKVEQVESNIGNLFYTCSDNVVEGTAKVIPRVFKKRSKKQRGRHVDIQLTLDALHAAYNNPVDGILIGSGDGDFIPVVKEIGRTGKQVYVAAFSSGLNKQLPIFADDFVDLDKMFFTKNQGSKIS